MNKLMLVFLLVVPGIASAQNAYTDPNWDSTPVTPEDIDLFVSRDAFHATADLSGYGLGVRDNVQSLTIAPGGSSEPGDYPEYGAIVFELEFTDVGPGFEILAVDFSHSAAENTAAGWVSACTVGPWDVGSAFITPGGAPVGGALGVNDGVTELSPTAIAAHAYFILNPPCSNDVLRIVFTHGDAPTVDSQVEVNLTGGVPFGTTRPVESGDGLVVGALQGAPLDGDLGSGDHGEGASFSFPLVPAATADVDGDGFSLLDGDCDDTTATIRPFTTEVCDGVDNDCDGGVDEDGDSPVVCALVPAPVTEADPDDTADGNLIIHAERWLPSVDLTGIDLVQDYGAGASTPGGVTSNVQSIFVRNWQGLASSGASVSAELSFPAGVTLLGWVIDTVSGGPVNRGLDSVFANGAADLSIPGQANTQFEAAPSDDAPGGEYSETEAEAVMERLQKLGYVE